MGVFSRTLANFFVSDDFIHIFQNPFVLNAHLWKRTLTTTLYGNLGTPTNFYRPLQLFTSWLLCRLGGPNPVLFHFVQLVLYAASAHLVYRIGRELFDDALVPFAGALLWALHPLHVKAVAFTSALGDVGCGFFYLLATWLFLRAEKAPGRSWVGHGLAALARLPAPFFKEMALSFPLAMLAYWYFFAPPSAWPRRLLRLTPYLVALAIYAVIRIGVLGRFFLVRNTFEVPLRVVGAALGLLGEQTRLFF